MTRQLTHRKKAEKPPLGAICFSLLLFFCFALMLRRADIAALCMQTGLALCGRAIVPSLFPFMVCSELLVASGAGEWLTAPLYRPLHKLLGLSRAGSCAVVLGLLCGFPVGARCAILAYEKGLLERHECERVLACSSIPSSAFLISTVGTTLWQNQTLGVVLYVSVAFSALLSGFLLYAMQKKEKKVPPNSPQPRGISVHFEAKMFPVAIKNATLNTLLICAYILFFTTLAGVISLVLHRFAANDILHAALAMLLEISGGVSALAKLANKNLAIVLTGAAVGWSGLSVHCQMLSLCDGHNLSTRPYLVAKLVQTVFCALTVGLWSAWMGR